MTSLNVWCIPSELMTCVTSFPAPDTSPERLHSIVGTQEVLIKYSWHTGGANTTNVCKQTLPHAGRPDHSKWLPRATKHSNQTQQPNTATIQTKTDTLAKFKHRSQPITSHLVMKVYLKAIETSELLCIFGSVRTNLNDIRLT